MRKFSHFHFGGNTPNQPMPTLLLFFDWINPQGMDFFLESPFRIPYLNSSIRDSSSFEAFRVILQLDTSKPEFLAIFPTNSSYNVTLVNTVNTKVTVIFLLLNSILTLLEQFTTNRCHLELGIGHLSPSTILMIE